MFKHDLIFAEIIKKAIIPLRKLAKHFQPQLLEEANHINKHCCLQILASMSRLDYSIISFITKYFFNAQYVFGTSLGNGSQTKEVFDQNLIFWEYTFGEKSYLISKN